MRWPLELGQQTLKTTVRTYGLGYNFRLFLGLWICRTCVWGLCLSLLPLCVCKKKIHIYACVWYNQELWYIQGPLGRLSCTSILLIFKFPNISGSQGAGKLCESVGICRNAEVVSALLNAVNAPSMDLVHSSQWWQDFQVQDPQATDIANPLVSAFSLFTVY